MSQPPTMPELPPLLEVWSAGAEVLEATTYDAEDWRAWRDQVVVWLRWLAQHAPTRLRCRPLVPLLIDGICSIDGSTESTLPLTHLVLSLENDLGVKPGHSDLARRLRRAYELANKYPPPRQPRATRPAVASSGPEASVDAVPPPPSAPQRPPEPPRTVPAGTAEGSPSAPPAPEASAPPPARQKTKRAGGNRKGGTRALQDVS